VIDYERTGWWRMCFAVRGTVLPYVLGRAGLVTGFCLLLYVVDEHLLEKLGFPLPALDPVGHTVLGTALSLLIVFRTNSSNGRYWEARSHWGMLVNSSRNLVRMGAVYAGPAEDLARLVAAYVVAVKETLRGNTDLASLRPLLSGRVFDSLVGASNPPSLLSRQLSEWIATRQAEGRLDSMHAMRMEQVVGTMVDAQGGCEKIRKTPLPFVYAALIKQILLLYLGTLPFVLVPKMDFVAPLVVAVVSLGMLGIEEAGVEVEDPFGLEPNHLPLDSICAAIAKDAMALAKAE
jgi:ion channel-forming bestrophin family protein